MTLAAPALPAVRVASIPAGHPYVRNVLSPTDVRLLPDPLPPGAPDGRWWPPVMCDAAWVTAHADRFDLMHLHFGTESYPTGHLRSLVRALRATGRPLVHTVHDLENPQLTDQAPHREHLDVLVEAADALITLTPGAAAAIERRWGRTADVIAHPHVLPLDGPAPAGTPSSAYVLGVHLRDLRPGTDAVPAVATLLDAVDCLRAQGTAATARVHINEQVRDRAAADRVTALVAGHPAAELRRTARLSDEALARSIADLDVAVLPYRTGTHSGWAELCWDLGVPVAGPPVGYASEQHPDDFAVFAAGNGAGLADSVRRLLAAGARPGSAVRTARLADRRAQRIAQAAAVTAAHTAVYERVLSRMEPAA
ncbi:glycosyltransferase [Actinoplanes sp. N902-109]|uniref:glycosyltransferase n=1 Tax=Actinoplanes sp. (strain N902-109) TaxID=649831 RepID=UPI0003295D10|nr:glycosyltransferase [Actinoplanes sp. N902-109]AGL16569.1 methyl-accepting chemotaxis protein [Actinoplanes sp. N902-109]